MSPDPHGSQKGFREVHRFPTLQINDSKDGIKSAFEIVIIGIYDLVGRMSGTTATNMVCDCGHPPRLTAGPALSRAELPAAVC
jgi:hypothetical protein